MLILLLSLIVSFTVLACDFSPQVKRIYSLSGATTLLLKDLNLISHPKLKGVSIFHPVAASEFSGEFLPGGVFLSHGAVKKLSGSVVFYDESLELTKIFARYPDIDAVEIKTRSMTPEGAIHSLQIVHKYFSHCPLSNQKNKIQDRLNELRKLIVAKPKILFFLGHFSHGKSPELLMIQDGVVKWMIEENLIETYPSQLAYVNWSSRIMNKLSGHKRIGIKDSGREMTVKVEKSGNEINLTYPGALIPGFGQVEAMIYLFKKL